jgi:hypothetical protein
LAKNQAKTCGGNLVVEKDLSNYCQKCGARNQSVKQIVLEVGPRLDIKLSRATKSLERGFLDEAEILLLDCHQVYAKFLRKDCVDHIHVTEPLSQLYETRQDYAKAIKYSIQTIYFTRLITGETSFQVLHQFVRLVELYLKMEKVSKDEEEKGSCHSNAKTYFLKSWTLFRSLMDMELKYATEEQLQVIPRLDQLVQTLGDEELNHTMDHFKLHDLSTNPC